MEFNLARTDHTARRGRLVFERGVVETPGFGPGGTDGTGKAMTAEELLDQAAEQMAAKRTAVVVAPEAVVSWDHTKL